MRQHQFFYQINELAEEEWNHLLASSVRVWKFKAIYIKVALRNSDDITTRTSRKQSWNAKVNRPCAPSSRSGTKWRQYQLTITTINSATTKSGFSLHEELPIRPNIEWSSPAPPDTQVLKLSRARRRIQQLPQAIQRKLAQTSSKVLSRKRSSTKEEQETWIWNGLRWTERLNYSRNR